MASPTTAPSTSTTTAPAFDPRTLPASHPLNPDSYAIGGGRLTGYTATIANAYYDAYRGKTKGEGDKYFPYLVWELDDIVLADGEPHEPMVVRHLAGWLAPGIDKKTGDFYKDRNTGEPLPGVMPSEDGINPAGATVEEYRTLGVGKASIEPGTEAQYRGRRTCGAKIKGWKKDGDRAAPAWYALESVAKAPIVGTDGATFTGWTNEGWALDMIGLRCRFDSVDKPGADNTMLVTEIVEVPAAGSVVKTPITTASTTAQPAGVASAATAATNGNADLDNEIAAILVATAEASPTPLTVLQAAQAVQKAFASNAKKMQQAVPRVKAPSVHEAATLVAMTSGKSWVYDAAKSTMTLVAG